MFTVHDKALERLQSRNQMNRQTDKGSVKKTRVRVRNDQREFKFDRVFSGPAPCNKINQ